MPEDLTSAFLAELQRVLGPPDGTEFYSIGVGGGDSEVATALAKLRELPSGIGYAELLRRLEADLKSEG